MVEFLVKLVKRAAMGNPGYPTAVSALMAGKIELPTSPVTREGELSLD